MGKGIESRANNLYAFPIPFCTEARALSAKRALEQSGTQSDQAGEENA
nr:hypothetical protein [uncultured Erythrobacter sp.]